ncbi:MAG: DsbA family oxidoreductase [Acidimicrobiales bacterium]
MTGVSFHFDVMCPWAYQTSRWIREARQVRDIDVRWGFFSLEEVNREEGKPHPWERPWAYGWSMLRVAALLRRRSNDDVDRFYEATGRALHLDGQPVQRREVLEVVMAEAGFDPATVAQAVDDPSTHDEVRADHDRVVEAGGYGVPTLFIDGGGRDGGTALFGPVITPAPVGEDAGKLWDLVAGWASFPHLYELRRPKTAADWEHIGEQFAPYLAARDWRTIQNPVA